MSETPRILAIETSGRTGSIAVGSSDEEVVECRIDAQGRRHGQTLIAEIKSLLDARGLGFTDLDGLAVSTGPGSFTGLRVGVVAAKTIAYAADLSLVPVETFDAIAAGVVEAGEAGRVMVLDDAQRGELFVREYMIAGSSVEPIGPLRIEPAREWIAARKSTDVVTGPGCDRFEKDLEGRCRVLAATSWHASAGIVVDLGVRNLVAGRAVDPVALEPAYRRRSSAEVKWDERRKREAGGE